MTEDTGILGCINDNDGSGFIHALLEAHHPGYAQTKSDHYRTHLAKSIRIGALPIILRERYGTETLSSTRASESRTLFNQAIAYGSPLPPTLLRSYAQYLGCSYRLHDAKLNVIEEEIHKDSRREPVNVVLMGEEEYHLLIILLPSKRGDRKGSVRFRISRT